MQEIERNKIREIKVKVARMLEERHALERSGGGGDASLVAPGEYWSDFCSYFDYMLGLAEESFAKLRIHTYHLTGDSYLTYYFGNRESFRAASNMDAMTSGIPPKYVLNEPEGGIGFHYDDGRFVSGDILRFQRVVNTFYRHNIFGELSSGNVDKKKPLVLEIGGGYGGLAHHIAAIAGSLTYIIVDLPETLVFSAPYLTLLNPDKRVYVYDPDDFEEALRPENIGGYDFVLLPNYRLDALAHLSFDLAANVASFQEMPAEQVVSYLDFVQATCRGTFYSWNQDRQPKNKELTSLSKLLGERFALTELTTENAGGNMPGVKDKLRTGLRKAARRTAVMVGLYEPPIEVVVDLEPYREFICRPPQ